jgi:hypothetical protein
MNTNKSATMLIELLSLRAIIRFSSLSQSLPKYATYGRWCGLFDSAPEYLSLLARQRLPAWNSAAN